MLARQWDGRGLAGSRCYDGRPHGRDARSFNGACDLAAGVNHVAAAVGCTRVVCAATAIKYAGVFCDAAASGLACVIGTAAAVRFGRRVSHRGAPLGSFRTGQRR